MVNSIDTLYLLKGPSWPCSYGSWIYNYLCNQCLSPLTLWVRISLRRGVLDTTLCDKVCQWLATGRWFSPGTPVSSTNKTDRHDITEILLKVALNTIKQTNYQNVFIDIKTRISSYWKNLITDCQQLFMFCLTHKKLISCSFQFLFFFSCIFVSTAIKVVMHLCVYVY